MTVKTPLGTPKTILTLSAAPELLHEDAGAAAYIERQLGRVAWYRDLGYELVARVVENRLFAFVFDVDRRQAVHYHREDPGTACVVADRAVAVDALMAEHDRMGHDGIGCGCLDALDAI